ncbi:MAG: hypothetical protein ACI9DC_001134 [Gammaproteobacteria bacterium]|jgi:hypothetical protein
MFHGEYLMPVVLMGSADQAARICGAAITRIGVANHVLARLALPRCVVSERVETSTEDI